MEIRVSSAKLNVGSNVTLTKDEAVKYVREEIEKVVEIFDIEPASASVSLFTEGSETDPVQKVEINLTLRGDTIHQEAHSRSIRKAIDRAIPELRRQVKKYKTKKIDASRNKARKGRKKMQTAMIEALNEE